MSVRIAVCSAAHCNTISIKLVVEEIYLHRIASLLSRPKAKVRCVRRYLSGYSGAARRNHPYKHAPWQCACSAQGVMPLARRSPSGERQAELWRLGFPRTRVPIAIATPTAKRHPHLVTPTSPFRPIHRDTDSVSLVSPRSIQFRSRPIGSAPFTTIVTCVQRIVL